MILIHMSENPFVSNSVLIFMNIGTQGFFSYSVLAMKYEGLKGPLADTHTLSLNTRSLKGL